MFLYFLDRSSHLVYRASPDPPKLAASEVNQFNIHLSIDNTYLRAESVVVILNYTITLFGVKELAYRHPPVRPCSSPFTTRALALN